MSEVPDVTIRRGNHTQAAETASLELLRDVQRELANALNSLGKQMITGALDKFIGFSGRHLNYAVEGYIQLRQANRVDASKLLVRPIIEFWFRLRAVFEKPELFYRIIFGEREKRSTWLRAIARLGGAPFDESAEAQEWERFRQHCISAIERCDVLDKPVTVETLATAAGLQKYYDTHYRTYCMFTHGHLEAVIGNFNPMTDSEDNLVVCLAGIHVIQVLASIGATNLLATDPLSDRLIALARSAG